MFNENQPIPNVGDIVWTKFPTNNGSLPKARPALVVRSSPSRRTLQVAYGTSKGLCNLHRREFAITKNSSGFQQTGLSYSTKFDMGRLVDLPFTNEWFAVAQDRNGPKNTPVLGILPASSYKEMFLAFMASPK